MKVLFIGGTGTISMACTQLAVARGFEVTLFNRARREAFPGARQIKADIADVATTRAALGGQQWDAVADFIAFTRLIQLQPVRKGYNLTTPTPFDRSHY